MTTIETPAATVDLGEDAERFRTDVREWLEANKPDKLRADDDGWPGRLTGPEMEAWARTCREAGFLCPAWPKEYGGGGLAGVKLAVLNEEFQRAGVPRPTRGMGESLVGPSIIVHGTDEQKETFLPRILDGTDRYCQGFSEPDSGSDLASVSTRGVIVDDEIVVTGQKVWTSWYRDATMIFCLVRTDPDVPKHRGISYVLIPVERDGEPNGVEFSPLRQITGDSHFAVTHLEEARAPLFNVIGGINEGWRVAMTTLGNERGGNATTQHLRFRKEFWRLVDAARERGKTDDPRVRQELAWAYTHVEIMRYQGLRLISAIREGRKPGPFASLNKMIWSEYHRRLGELAMNILGPEAIASEDGDLGPWAYTFLRSRSGTIWGGTAEIQRNIVGERVLGLPKEPKPSRAE